MMKAEKTPWYALHAPENGLKFDKFYNSCHEEGVLDKVTKELLSLALASVFRDAEGIEKHIKGALKAGATKTEITEVLLLTAAESANSQIKWAGNTYCKYIGQI